MACSWTLNPPQSGGGADECAARLRRGIRPARRSARHAYSNGGRSCLGMLMALTHHDIAQLYAASGLQHYLPEAVLAHTMESQAVPALCYNLAEPPSASERNPAYAAQLKAVLQGLGFPAEYVASIQ